MSVRSASARRSEAQKIGRIFILKSKADSLRAAEDHLTSVGWRIDSSLDIVEMLRLLELETPDYLLLSVEHTDSRTADLPKTIAAAYPDLRVVLYGEAGSARTLGALQTGQTEYTLFPPISGHSIDRMLARVKRHDQREQERQKNALIASVLPLVTETEDFKQSRAKDALSMLVRGRAPDASVNSQVVRQGLPITHLERIARAVSVALDQCARSEEQGVEAERIGQVNRVAAITVRSSTVTGYLVAAYGDGRELDTDFCLELRRRFVTAMHVEDQTVTTENEMRLDLNTVSFTEWAESDAAFLKTSMHDGHEVAVAFFAPKTPQAPLKATIDGQMLIIDISEIIGDSKIEFDLYLYLPNNQKMLLYNRHGRIFENLHRDRLVLKGVQQMYLPRDQEAAVMSYRARNFLNHRIAAYPTLALGEVTEISGFDALADEAY